MIIQMRVKPYSAPALVDWTKWETPTDTAANRSPGPKALSVPLPNAMNVPQMSGFGWLKLVTLSILSKYLRRSFTSGYHFKIGFASS